jgi:hypothetical protein
MGSDQGNAARGLCGQDTTGPLAPEEPDIGATRADRPVLPEQRRRASRKAGRLPRAGELTAATGALRGLEDHMRLSVGWRAHRLMGNVHPPHGGNPTPHWLTTVDGFAPTGVEGGPDADLLEHAEGETASPRPCATAGLFRWRSAGSRRLRQGHTRYTARRGVAGR